MASFELSRSDIGFGKVYVDDRGVTRTTLLGRQEVAWGEIEDYRLTVELASQVPDALYLFGDELTTTVAHVGDAIQAYRGEHRFKLGIELTGSANRTVEFDWRFENVERAIAAVLDRVHDRLLAAARRVFDVTRVVTFGPLTLSDDGVRWNGAELARRDVQSIELFNSSPVSLRVSARNRIWPHGAAPTAEIPNLLAALMIARELGYPVRGINLLRAVATART